MKMNIRSIYRLALVASVVGATAGCQSDSLTDQVEGAPSYRIVVDAGGVDTRLLRERPDHLLDSYWEVGDQLMAYRINDNNSSSSTAYSLISSLNAGQYATFTGDISTASGSFSLSDEICFFYPGSAAVGNDKTLEATVDAGTAPDKYHETANKIKNRVEVNLSVQDGTVATIGRKYDYQWAKARPTAIEGTELRASFGKMERQIAIWGVRFADEAGSVLTDIDSIYVSNVRSRDVFDLGTGQWVGHANDNTSTIVIKPTDGTKLTSAAGKYTYFATVPGEFKEVLFVVHAKGKVYEKTYATVTLKKDDVYHTNVLGMTEITRKPYVEVQGVKWATGNFIHYKDPNSSQEYWGIAPAQWWISKFATQNSAGRTVSSQFVPNYEMNPDDMDLWRFGSIEKALTLKAQDHKSFGGSHNIAKKFWTWSAALYDNQTTADKAKHGDLVWYHTMNDNQKYRWPSDAELDELYQKANVIPAWCSTSSGTLVFGAYFTTNNGEPRVKKIPTGKLSTNLNKYENVTALVRAGKGLFLPITGRRSALGDIVGYREMAQNAYGQYWSDCTGAVSTSRAFFFGIKEWNFSIGTASGEAGAIRPVWDESSTSTPNPVFPAFQSIG